MTITDAGKVGIGTVTPGDLFHINTTGNVGGLRFGNAQNLNAGTIRSNWNSIDLIADQNLTFQTNSNTRMKITNGGDVGIGSIAPTGKLDIAPGGNSYIKFDQDADNPKMEWFRSTGNASNTHYSFEIQQILGDLKISTAAAADLGSHTYTERLRITSGGVLCVGATAADGDEFLRVKNKLLVMNTANTGDAFVKIKAGESGGSVLEFEADEGDDYADLWRVQNAGDGLLGFRTKASGSWVQKLSVHNDKVMFSVDAKVDANNTRDLGADGAKWKRLFLGTQLNIDATSSTGMIMFDVAGTNFARMGHNSASGTNILDIRSEGHMRFLTNGNNERLRITSAGRVLIGDSAATSLLSVGGSNYNWDQGDIPMLLIEGANNEAPSSGSHNISFQIVDENNNLIHKVWNAGGGNADKGYAYYGGRLLIGTTTEGYSSGDDLTIATTGHTGITIRSGTSSEGAIYFSDATSGGGEYIASLVYSHNTNAMMFTTNGSERVRITGDSNTCTLKLYNQANADASATCEIQANHDIRDSSKIVFGRENANDWSASWASQHSNISFHTFNGSSNLTEKMHIKANGAAQFTTTGSYDTYTTAQNAFQFRHNFTNVAGVWISNTNTSHTKELIRLDSARSGSSSFDLATFTTGNLGDDQFRFRGDGNAYADASWNASGADYAEYFEWTDGNSSDEDRRGMTVVLDGNKVKPSTSSDSADNIIGVVSASPVVVGDSAYMAWTDKYLRDDYGAYDLDENGERKLNPSYDDTKTYVTREDRKEWDTIGMVGKLRIRKGQKTGTRWIKMRDISDSIEEWLVR